MLRLRPKPIHEDTVNDTVNYVKSKHEDTDATRCIDVWNKDIEVRNSFLRTGSTVHDNSG